MQTDRVSPHPVAITGLQDSPLLALMASNAIHIVWREMVCNLSFVGWLVLSFLIIGVQYHTHDLEAAPCRKGCLASVVGT